MPDENGPRSFWVTLPGILTQLTALVAAIAGLVTGLVAAGVIGRGPEQAATLPESFETATAAPTPTPTLTLTARPTPTTSPPPLTSTPVPGVSSSVRTLPVRSVEGHSVIDPDGQYWERLHPGAGLVGLYLRLRDVSEFAGFYYADFLELCEDGSFAQSVDSASSEGRWSEQGSAVAFASNPTGQGGGACSN